MKTCIKLEHGYVKHECTWMEYPSEVSEEYMHEHISLNMGGEFCYLLRRTSAERMVQAWNVASNDIGAQHSHVIQEGWIWNDYTKTNVSNFSSVQQFYG